HVGCETVEQEIVLSKSRHLDVDLPHAKNTLSNVTVSSQGTASGNGFKAELSAREMEQTRGLSLAAALEKINGVQMLQTGSTIAKPIIHGLHSNRILTINNGVRQEGQQWGNEHAPEIDPFIAGKLSVIKGVDELKYGSDGIGGVILVEPRALMSSPGTQAEVNTAWFSNNRQYLVSAMFEQQLKSLPAFTYRLQGTYRKAGNASTPNYTLNNTANEEKNFSVTAGWKKHRLSSELFYSFFDTKVGIFEGAHIGNFADLQTAINSSRPDPAFTGEQTYRIGRPYQDVRHQLLKSNTVLNAGNHKIRLLLAGQFNDRKEFDVTRSSSTTTPQLDLSIYSFTQDLQWSFTKGNVVHLTGLSAMQQENQYAGRYFIPAYTSLTLGGFYIGKWQLKKWNLQGGIRYDNKDISTNRLRAGGTVFDEYNFNFSTLASSFNVAYNVSKEFKTNINIAVASRAPHVNELLSSGIHHGTATFEQGDVSLQPEKAFNINLNASWAATSGKFQISTTLYRNSINDFIYQQPKPDEPVLTIAGAFPKLVYTQNDALLQGIDFASKTAIVKQLDWELKYSMLRANNRDANDWLIRMPADRIQNEITYSLADGKRFSKTYFSTEIINVLKQTRVPADKNGPQDYKAAPPGYLLWNMDAGTTIEMFHWPVHFSFGVRNILNTAYRDYMNSMRFFTDETGRNFQLRLKLPIKKLH
ncbi:MAG: TonB-dependent receptor, partial [Chitinophagaceae bacterium]